MGRASSCINIIVNLIIRQLYLIFQCRTRYWTTIPSMGGMLPALMDFTTALHVVRSTCRLFGYTDLSEVNLVEHFDGINPQIGKLEIK